MTGTSRCKLHKARLEPGSARVHYGDANLSPAYEAARVILFPYARSHFFAPGPSTPGLPDRRDVLCCRQCREAESDWLATSQSS